MAKAYQCDRCMNYYTENKEVIIPGNSTDAIATGIVFLGRNAELKRTYELCDACLGELTNWVAFRTVTRK